MHRQQRPLNLSVEGHELVEWTHWTADAHVGSLSAHRTIQLVRGQAQTFVDAVPEILCGDRAVRWRAAAGERRAADVLYKTRLQAFHGKRSRAAARLNSHAGQLPSL